MKTVLLGSKEIRGVFRSLDPYDRMDLVGLPGAFALGSTVEDEGHDAPAGLCVVVEGDDSLVIEWMYTLPAYRGIGVGSHFLELAFEEAKGRGLSDVTVRISEEYLRNGLFWDPEEFFYNDVFTQEDAEASEWQTTMSRLSRILAKQEKENERAARDEGIVALSECSKKDFADAFRSLKERMKLHIPDSFPRLLNSADANLSFFLKDADAYEGVFLCHRTETAVYPYFLAAPNKDDEELLARAALYTAEELLSTRDQIRIRCERMASEELLHKLKLPADIYAVASLTASTAVYDKQRARFSE